MCFGVGYVWPKGFEGVRTPSLRHSGLGPAHTVHRFPIPREQAPAQHSIARGSAGSSRARRPHTKPKPKACRGPTAVPRPPRHCKTVYPSSFVTQEVSASTGPPPPITATHSLCCCRRPARGHSAASPAGPAQELCRAAAAAPRCLGAQNASPGGPGGEGGGGGVHDKSSQLLSVSCKYPGASVAPPSRPPRALPNPFAGFASLAAHMLPG